MRGQVLGPGNSAGRWAVRFDGGGWATSVPAGGILASTATCVWRNSRTGARRSSGSGVRRSTSRTGPASGEASAPAPGETPAACNPVVFLLRCLSAFLSVFLKRTAASGNVISIGGFHGWQSGGTEADPSGVCVPGEPMCHWVTSGSPAAGGGWKEESYLRVFLAAPSSGRPWAAKVVLAPASRAF